MHGEGDVWGSKKALEDLVSADFHAGVAAALNSPSGTRCGHLAPSDFFRIKAHATTHIYWRDPWLE